MANKNAAKVAVVSITAEEAADRIKQSGLLDETHPMSAEDRHRANFAGRVCSALNLDPTVENFARVEAAMEELQIVPHAGHEYPKWVKTGRKVQVYDVQNDKYVDGPVDELVIVHDADEEAHAGDVLVVNDDQPSERPEPRTEIPTRGLIPATPGTQTAEAPANYPMAGQGRLQDERQVRQQEEAKKQQEDANKKAAAERDKHR